MSRLVKKINNSYSNSPKALLVGDIPIRETSADLTQGHPILFASSFNYTTEKVFENYIEDTELTQLCMSISETSLAKEWENEDNERWEAFLK